LAVISEASAATIDPPLTVSVIGPVWTVAGPLSGAVTFAVTFGGGEGS
jgi:hypothetical protein